MATRDETINLSPFRVGREYTRPQIAAMGGVTVPEEIYNSGWDKGLVEFKNALLLFVTLDKKLAKDSRHAYVDYFEDRMLWWQSQNRQDQQDRLIVRMADGSLPVFLFARLTPKVGNNGRPFVYCGRLSPPVMEGDKPVDCLFDVIDYEEGAAGALGDVYAWRPGTSVAPSRQTMERRAAIARKRGGQGFLLDKELRVALERYAMDRARAHYEAAGYVVEDTSANRPYDFVCTKDEERRRVEVKGTSTAGERIILTSGEVFAARESDTTTDLFVVRHIEITRTDDSRELSGGLVHLIENWVPHDDHLEAKQYSYQVPAVA